MLLEKMRRTDITEGIPTFGPRGPEIFSLEAHSIYWRGPTYRREVALIVPERIVELSPR